MARPTGIRIDLFRFALGATMIAALFAALPAMATGDAATIRIARHTEFLRIVIATAKRLNATPSLSRNGRQLSIILPASLHLALPSRLVTPITAIRQPRKHGGKRMSLLIGFGTPMALRHNMVLPAAGRPGFRLVLDFQAIAKTKPVPAEPLASIPVPPPPDAVLKQAGFVSGRFGLSDTDLLAQLAATEAPDQNPVRMTIDAGTEQARPLVRIGRQSPRYGRFQTIYEFTALHHRLAGISAEWGKDAANPLDDDTAQDLMVSLSAALAFIGFDPTSSELGAPLAGDGRIGFSGLDRSGRLATLAIYPIPAPRGSEAEAGGLFLRLTMTDPAVTD